jgi:hypothetical protein
MTTTLTPPVGGLEGKDGHGARGTLVKPKVGRLARVRILAIEGVLFLLLAVGGGLLAWGGNFAHNMVHDQLAAQRIGFPAKGSPALDPKEFPGLQRYAGDAPAVTDDRPRIEYATWVRRAEFPQVLQRLLTLQTEPPLTGADAGMISDIGLEREVLHTFYTAGLDAYYGDREAWALHMRQVMRTDPDNPYYGWFGGGHRTPGPTPSRNAP